MAVSRADRRRSREPIVVEMFGPEVAPSVLDLLELVEFAWHDCYGEITPADAIIDDILLVSEGELGALVRAARLAITDSRDLRVEPERQR